MKKPASLLSKINNFSGIRDKFNFSFLDELGLYHRLNNSVYKKPVSAIFCLFFRCIRLFLPKRNGSGVIIISFNKIGDTVFTFKAIEQIKNYFADKKITIISQKSGKEIYNYFFPDIDVIELSSDSFWFRRKIARVSTLRLIHKLNPEVIINLSDASQASSLLLGIQANTVIGAGNELFKCLYTHFVKMRTTPPLHQIYTDIIKPVVTQNDAKSMNAGKWEGGREIKILIHPFAGWKAKEWGLNKFIQLAVKLRSKYPVTFVIEEKPIYEEIIPEIESLGFVVKTTKTVSDLISLLNEYSVIISNDTGCIYLGEALKKGTYTIYGPSNPDFTVPQGDNHAYIQKKLSCTPITEKMCFTFGGRIGCPSFECMRTLSIEEVYSDVYRFLMNLSSKSVPQY